MIRNFSILPLGFLQDTMTNQNLNLPMDRQMMLPVVYEL